MKRIIETFRVYEYRRETVVDDAPSLPPMPAATVYDAEGEEVVTQVRGPKPLAKCGPVVKSGRRSA